MADAGERHGRLDSHIVQSERRIVREL